MSSSYRLSEARAQKIYRVFISHPWSRTDSYTRVVTMLNEAARFKWHNHSAPQDKPVVDPTTKVGKKRMRAELEDQIRGTGCVIVLGGMYVAYREWIQAELEIAVGWGKPILGVKPWGAVRTPSAVVEAADEIVGWNTTSIVAAVRRLHT